MSHINVTTKVDQKTYRMVKVVAGFTDQTMSEFIASVVKDAVDNFDYLGAITENTSDVDGDGGDNDTDTDSVVDTDSDDDREVDNDTDNDNGNYHDTDGGYHGADSVVENSHGDY